MSVRLGANYALHRIHAGPLPITRSIAMPSSQRSSSGNTRSAKRPLWPCLISLVRMVVINWQGCGPGEPKNISALDLNGRHERHEHVLVVVRMVDDLYVLVLRLGGHGHPA